MLVESWYVTVKEVYKGYQIIKKRNGLGEYSSWFSIYKDDEPYSILSLNSVKACKNVIDTHLRRVKA